MKSKQRNRKNRWLWTQTKSAKHIFLITRWLHIYLSTALFSLLIFFCFTGITLNHSAWFSEQGNPQKINFKLPSSLQAQFLTENELPLNRLKQHIDIITSLDKPRSIDVDIDVGEITLDYPIPAGYVFVTVFVDSGIIEVEHKSAGIFTLMNDLHKGRYSGKYWSWVIDISAFIMLLFSITGLIILLQNAKHRKWAIAFVFLGSLAPWFIYLLWVPRFG